MKLPSDTVAATLVRKDPDKFDEHNHHNTVLSDTNFGDATKKLKTLSAAEVERTFILVGRNTYKAIDVLSIVAGEKIPGAIPKTELDEFFQHSNFNGAMHELKSIIGTGALNADNVRAPLFKSALTMALILLKDLLFMAKDAGVDLIIRDDRGETNLLEVVKSARNAACHVFTPETNIESSDVRFLISIGKDKALAIGQHDLGCEFPDDAAIIFGNKRIYLKRDFYAAYNLLQTNVDKILHP